MTDKWNKGHLDLQNLQTWGQSNATRWVLLSCPDLINLIQPICPVHMIWKAVYKYWARNIQFSSFHVCVCMCVYMCMWVQSGGSRGTFLHPDPVRKSNYFSFLLFLPHNTTYMTKDTTLSILSSKPFEFISEMFDRADRSIVMYPFPPCRG